MSIGATLKDRFFRVDLDKGFARVRSKVESVVSSQSLEANVGLGEGDLVDGSLAKELSKLERSGMPNVSGPVLPRPDQVFSQILKSHR